MRPIRGHSLQEGLFRIDREAEKSARMYSVIHWNDGTPEEPGMYLVTLVDGSVRATERRTDEAGKGYWEGYREVNVTAWCSLDRISPCRTGNEKF